jgi:uncharacterized protein (TIGR02453 family)
MFTASTFSYLDELTDNNNRQWFEANKARYESTVREPALAFIAAMAPALADFAPNFRADPRRMGGSLMRVYRDTRFSRDKTPYKTNIGIQFRHALGKDVHAPGFYLHIAAAECFLGAGCWHPDPQALTGIRQRIAEDPARWFAVRDDRAFQAQWALAGERLARPPRGYAADHPAIADLQRKDFVAMAPLTRTELLAPEVIQTVAGRFAAAVPLMAFLCAAADAPY